MTFTTGSAQKSTQAIQLAPLPCGVVIFDHPTEVGAGTAYLPNTPVQRIRSANDLRNDVLWISNVSAFTDRIQNYPNLRNNYYFRVSLSEIAQDMGISTSGDGEMAPDDAMRLAVIATRTMTIAARAYGWDVTESGPLRVQESYLMRDVSKALTPAPRVGQPFRDEITAALTQAYQDASRPDWPDDHYEPESVYVTLRFNRVSYVRQMLKHPIPTGSGWVRAQTAPSGGDLLSFCLENPTIVKATVEWDNATSDLAALAAYGQTGRRNNPMRLWISQPELVWLSRYATITISAAWVDRGGVRTLGPGALLPELFDTHPESSLSYSAGLVAMNHWLALASGQWNRKLRIEESNIWATWLRALDRAMMFSVALKAYEQGFHVVRYGGGAISIRIHRDRVDDLAKLKAQCGFAYPDLSVFGY